MAASLLYLWAIHEDKGLQQSKAGKLEAMTPEQEVREAWQAWKDAERKAVKAMQLATRYYYVWAHLTHLGITEKNLNGSKPNVHNIRGYRINSGNRVK